MVGELYKKLSELSTEYIKSGYGKQSTCMLFIVVVLAILVTVAIGIGIGVAWLYAVYWVALYTLPAIMPVVALKLAEIGFLKFVLAKLLFSYCLTVVASPFKRAKLDAKVDAKEEKDGN